MKHLLATMTYPEFKARMAEDPVILLPLGSVEVQGPCNPMGDYMLAGVLAEKVALRTGAIAAPTMPFGCADYFRDVPGGMQVSAATFRGVLHDMVMSFIDHGLTRLLVFNGHTGNNALIDQTLREIRRATGVVVPWINIWPMVPESLRRQAHGDNAPRASGHGSDPIGSVYEYIFPGMTRRDLAGAAEPAKTLLGLPTVGLTSVKFDKIDVGVPINMLDHCHTVVGGDPSLANPAAGKLFSDFIVDTASALVEDRVPGRGVARSVPVSVRG
jgi:creatinine amidohydrolase